MYDRQHFSCYNLSESTPQKYNIITPMVRQITTGRQASAVNPLWCKGTYSRAFFRIWNIGGVNQPLGVPSFPFSSPLPFPLPSFPLSPYPLKPVGCCAKAVGILNPPEGCVGKLRDL